MSPQPSWPEEGAGENAVQCWPQGSQVFSVEEACTYGTAGWGAQEAPSSIIASGCELGGQKHKYGPLKSWVSISLWSPHSGRNSTTHRPYAAMAQHVQRLVCYIVLEWWATSLKAHQLRLLDTVNLSWLLHTAEYCRVMRREQHGDGKPSGLCGFSKPHTNHKSSCLD